MKLTVVASSVLLTLSGASVSLVVSSAAKDRTITRVVKQLQDMLHMSKAEGETERTAYAKFKCSCDSHKEEKTSTIEESDKSISLLESSIEELKGSNGVLSEETAQLKTDIADNVAARQEAEDIRTKSNGAYLEEKTDLEAAIGQLNAAISTLVEVNADQTDDDGAMDNKKFMAGFDASKASLLRVKSSVKSALNAAAAFAMDSKQKKLVTAFAQAPFTGSYTSQSVEVMGILKNMRDTFESNLDAANTKEATEVAQHLKFMDTKNNEFTDLNKAYDKKQALLGENDDTLAKKLQLLDSAKSAKSSAEAFLNDLIPTCADKAAEYKKRNLLRSDEEMAITEAISILDSDESFATFGTVEATSSGATSPSFVQQASVHRHTSERTIKEEVVAQLQAVKKSARLAKIAATVQGNPFAIVMSEIQNMLTLIKEEQASDEKKKTFCETERKQKGDEIADMETEIDGHKSTIESLHADINAPMTGLLAQITSTEDQLRSLKKSMAEALATYESDTIAYQINVKNLNEAEGILTQAILVLKEYYTRLEGALKVEFLQKETTHKQLPDATLNLKGQSSKGNSAINMLEYIKSETIKERETATSDYNTMKGEYEKSLESNKDMEASHESEIARLTSELGSTKKSKMMSEQELAATEQDQAATKAYLADIKPGCDFIVENFKLRTTNRLEEKSALTKAIELVKSTPAYMNAEAEAQLESFGNCHSKCEGAEKTLACKACMADVTEVAYCAGHPNQVGCD